MSMIKAMVKIELKLNQSNILYIQKKLSNESLLEESPNPTVSFGPVVSQVL